MSDREKWNGRYAVGGLGIQQPDDIVVQAASFTHPGRALDIACGTGRNALFLARSGWSVLGIDISDVALDQLQGTASSEALIVETLQVDLTAGVNLPADTFHLICNCRYLQRNLFSPLCASLAPGGLLVAVIAMQDDDPMVKPMNPDYELRPGELMSFAAGLQVVIYEEAKHGPAERKMARMIAQRPD